jgi:hypothetical protein
VSADEYLDFLSSEALDSAKFKEDRAAVAEASLAVRDALLTPMEAAGLVAGINAFSEGPIVTVVWSHDLLAKLRRIAGDS